MLSLPKYFLLRKLSKYLRQNMTDLAKGTDKHDYLDILMLSDAEYEEDYFDEDPRDLHPVSSKRKASRLAGNSMDAIRDFVDSNYTDMSFSQRLILYMNERDITTAIIYKRSFLDRKLISKITSSRDYHPSKQTVFALCIALRLTLDESTEFLGLAGYTFSCHKKYDLIIKFFLNNQIYNIDTINDILFRFHEPCFGE